MEKQTFTAGGKNVTLYKAETAGRPLIVLNNYDSDGAETVNELQGLGAPECNLLVVSGLDWDRDMSPWSCPPPGKNQPPFTGGADDYLMELTGEIIPKAMGMISGSPSFTGIAGYSLAGLFALYSLYKCDTFDRAASMSGSLWFPDFKGFAMTSSMVKKPDRLYLSLGDREAKTRNQMLRTVQDNTEVLAAYYTQQGIDVTWELNPGNHFRDPDLRTAKGIKAILG